MSKRIKKDDPMYREALSWMAYHYAIGITEFPNRNFFLRPSHGH